MGNVLMVPVQLDALYVETERVVVEATTDFSKLPHTANGHDVHPNNPYISEEIVSKPFQNNNLNLAEGVHLHWTLPDALTQGIQDGTSETEFPLVPNRWLIRRSKEGTEDFTRQWVVLSDYLWPAGQGEGRVCVPNPKPQQANDENYIPYRFLGHVIPFENYIAAKEPFGDGFDLTVLGHGEPTFAAFYPNCHSVFGFHDKEITENQRKDLKYEVAGWYSNPQKDFLKIQIAEFQKLFDDEKTAEIDELTEILTEEQDSLSDEEKQQLTEEINNIGIQPTQTEIWDYIKKNFKWKSPNQDNSQVEDMICYADINFQKNPNLDYKDEARDQVADVSVGITGTEALSAYLGHTLSSDYGLGDKEKRMIEEQMEALLMDLHDGDQLDTGSRFRQNRHEEGFIADDAGNYWIINKEGDQIIDDKETDKKWNDARELLTELNTLQLEYDNKTVEVNSLQEQLYADWYKYMVCAYPPEGSWDTVLDIDEVKYFVEEAGLKPVKELNSRLNNLGPIVSKKRDDLNKELIKLNDGLQEIAIELNNAKLIEINKENQTGSPLELKESEKIVAPKFSLAEKPRPRFWKPKDPVVMAVGDTFETSKRYGKDGWNDPDGLLACEVLANYNVSEIIGQDVLWNKIEAIRNQAVIDQHPAFHNWKSQPWNPLMLEWKAQLFPVENRGNTRKDALDFEPTFITDNFVLNENAPDVSYQAVGESYVPSASIYFGSSILTSHASSLMTGALKNYIKKNVLDKCLINKTSNPIGLGYFEERTDIAEKEEYLSKVENLELVKKWYEEKRFPKKPEESQKNVDLSYITIKALITLSGDNFHSLSQSLGGFNESLLMRKETLELKIKDPLAFPEYRMFTEDVEETVNTPLRAPLPQNDFNPLRAGKLSLTDLRVIDSFGQSIELDISNGLITSEYLEAPGNLNQVLLRPRFLQAAQVHFRWLAAKVEAIESNETRHYGPICGWLMTNNLDNSLMVFDSSGKALGAFTESDRDWKPVPGENGDSGLNSDLSKWKHVKSPGTINPHLYNMMFYIRERMMEAGNTFLTHFRKSINSALENIQPDTFAQHNSMAQLMGRPIALVRASLDLVLKTPPAIHQGWDVFKMDMERRKRETNEFTRVNFPIRIGEHDQLNDGVVGYWVEGKNGKYSDDKFYSPSSDEIETPYIVTHLDNEVEATDFNNEGFDKNGHKDHLPVNQLQTLDDDPMTVSLLLDPRGKVNLTTGLLPVKTIDIPPKLYTEAMDRIEVFFVSSPHLVDKEGLRFDLPKENGYEWSFIRKNTDKKWDEKKVLTNTASETVFTGEKRIVEGWLKLKPTTDDTNNNS